VPPDTKWLSGLRCVSFLSTQSLARDKFWHALVRKDASHSFLSSLTFAHLLVCSSHPEKTAPPRDILENERNHRERCHGAPRRQPRRRGTTGFPRRSASRAQGISSENCVDRPESQVLVLRSAQYPEHCGHRECFRHAHTL
jgi:hypothetical protein